MRNPTGSQSGYIQNAEQIYNFTDHRDWLAHGRRRLAERAYGRAARCFEEYLDRAPEEESGERVEAHVLLVIAILAGNPPSSRTLEQVVQIKDHLLAASTDLAAVLAGLVCDDYYATAGIAVPADLADLAERADPTRLGPPELRLVERHFAPATGLTWQALCDHSASVGMRLPRPGLSEPTPVASTDRRIGVPKYFIAVPTTPPPDRTLAAATTVGFGLALLVAPCVGLRYLHLQWFVGLALLVLLPTGGVTTVLIGIGLWRDSQQDRLVRRRYEEARAAAAGRPSDGQMDRWLKADVEWIIARGARRLRLNPAVLADSGDLLVKPQAAVGVSRLQHDESLERIVSEQGSTTMARIRRRRTAVGKSRVGRDGKIRSDHYQVLVLYLSAHRVSVFTCDLDLATRRLLTESTQTFHYRDVVSISSRTDLLASEDPAHPGIRLFDETTGRYVWRYADSRFTLHLVNGQPMDVSVGVNADSRDMEVAWANGQVFHVVNRMVWSRKEQEA